jgi:DNA-binding transcriptional ArsR family regulator
MDHATRQLYDLKARLLGALGHPVRLAIVELLAEGEMCVCDIARRVGGERTGISRHLALLQSVGLLSSRKEGLMVFYKLEAPCILNSLSCVTEVLRQRQRSTAKLLARL